MHIAFKTALAATALSLSAGLALAQGAGDAKQGKEIFIKNGCFGCHGFDGQGGNAGPKIAPDPMPADALTTFLRNAAATRMPPYDAKGLPDADVVHIRAYLASIAKTGDWKKVPLLQP